MSEVIEDVGDQAHVTHRDTPDRQLRFCAVARPPFRPAAFFWAVVPPWDELPPEPDFFPPRLDAPGELAIRAARSFDMPFSFNASYWSSFVTLGLLSGTVFPPLVV